MKAFVLRRTGTLDDLESAEFHFKPNAKKVKIKVLYTGVNHLDLLIIEGKRQTNGKFPLILGSEIVGQNQENGEIAAIYPWTFCGKCTQCRNGNENICDSGGTYGRTENGGYAEYIAVDKKNLVKIPDNLDPKLISASTLSAITALHLIRRAKIPDQAEVLINGASGGVGTAAIQILKNKKCRIIASTANREKIEKLIKTGVNEVVLTKDLSESIKKISQNGLPFIIDLMGGRIWSESVELLAKNGTIVFCATTLEELGQVNIGKALNRQINILGSYGGTVKDLKKVIELIQKGIINPVIDSVFPLEKLPEALEKLREQKAFGKILIKVS